MENCLSNSTNSLNDESNQNKDNEILETIYNDRYPTLVFFTPLALKCIQRKTNDIAKKRYTSIGEKYNMCFKMIKSDSKLVKTILFSYGFLQCSAKNPNCNLFWTNTHVGSHVLRSLRPWQRINHFPRSFMITKKDTLYESIDKAMVQYGSCFEFIPDYFCTPISEEKLAKLITLCRQIEDGQAAPFIVKPACSSRGRDISFIRSVDDAYKFDNNAKLLISRYIDRPFLIRNLKSDLRIYVLVTSFYPLIVYIYSDGLARFAVHEYDEKNRKNYSDVNTHLTNYSLNKTSSHFVKNVDCSSENVGHKWTLGAFLREFEKQGYDSRLLMVRIEDIVIKTLLSIQGSVAASCRKFNLHPKCCFELFGFDILIDEDLKPWLLEVNLSPSLACDAPLDSVLKTHLLCDTLNIASIPLARERNSQNSAFVKELQNLLESQDDQLSTVSTSSLPNTAMSSTSSCFCNVLSTKSSDNCDCNLHNDNKASKNKLNDLTNGTENLNENMQKGLVHSASCGAVSCQSLNRKRKINTARVSKIRRAQLSCKPCFSANSITPQYLFRAKCHFEKLQLEAQRKGRFIRVFPRPLTWSIYGFISEDVGQEKWDEDLHNRLNEGIRMPELSVRNIEAVHEQLLNTKKYPTSNDLDPLVRNYILKQALEDAGRYKMKMYNADLKPYPAALPFVRLEARRRTKSQILAEETRRHYLQTKKQRMENEKISTQTTNTVDQIKDNNENQAIDNTQNKINGNLNFESELTTNFTIVLDNFNSKNGHNIEENGNKIKTFKITQQNEKEEKQLNNSKTMAEVNLNFTVKKGKDGSIVLEDDAASDEIKKNRI